MIEIKDLHKSYKMGSSSLHVLKGINFNIQEGDFEKMLNLCSIFVALSFPIYEKK